MAQQQCVQYDMVWLRPASLCVWSDCFHTNGTLVLLV